MSKTEKLIAKFLKNPGSLHYSEVDKILIHYGFTRVPAKGSHVKYKHQHLQHDLVIPVHDGDCNKFYKEMARKLIRSLLKK